MNTHTHFNSVEGPFKDAIRNPNVPEHMMLVQSVSNRVRAYVGDDLIADTEDAVRVIEIGKSVYDPVIYFPVDDLKQNLNADSRVTHCPLKGDASYLIFNDEEIAWKYETFDFASCLTNRLAFWASKVRIVEGDSGA
jgi:uncharacterized protein (DUF427 family)